MTQNRWKSKLLWTAIASLVALLMTQYGLWQFIGLDENVFTKIVEMVLGIMGMIGVVNNPENPVDW